MERTPAAKSGWGTIPLNCLPNWQLTWLPPIPLLQSDCCLHAVPQELPTSNWQRLSCQQPAKSLQRPSGLPTARPFSPILPRTTHTAGPWPSNLLSCPSCPILPWPSEEANHVTTLFKVFQCGHNSSHRLGTNPSMGAFRASRICTCLRPQSPQKPRTQNSGSWPRPQKLSHRQAVLFVTIPR